MKLSNKKLFFGSLISLSLLSIGQTRHTLNFPPLLPPTNAAFGVGALMTFPFGTNNSASGINALNANTGNNNTATGFDALRLNSTSSFNTANGSESSRYNTLGNENTTVGYKSGWNNASTNYNTYVGAFSGGMGAFGNGIGGVSNGLNGGAENTAIGHQSLGQILNGARNSACGNNAGVQLQNGTDNCLLGYGAGDALFNGSRNVYIYADGPTGGAFFNANGNNNTAVGYRAGLNLMNPSHNNIFIGAWSGPLFSGITYTNAIAIGAGTNNFPATTGAIIASNDNMILGNNSIRVGIGLSGLLPAVQNKLELNCDVVYPYTGFTATSPFNPSIPGSWPVATGASGLRFRDLTSASTPVPVGTGSINPLKVLSVDGNGDVVLISALTPTGGPGCCIGNICNLPTPGTNPLLTNWEVPLNNKNYIFSGSGTTAQPNYRVGIGNLPGLCTPGNKLEITADLINAASGQSLLNGISGLRLTNLTTTSTPVANPGRGVLSVDKNGDVVYVLPSSGGSPVQANNGLQVSGTGFVQLGGDCSIGSEVTNSRLQSDREMPLYDANTGVSHHIWMSGLISNATNGPGGRVGIGVIPGPACTLPGNRLEVNNGVGPGASVSGLRLTDLSAPFGPQASNGMALSVNASGDVILTTVSGGPGLGANCPALPASGISAPYEIPLNGFGLNFTTPTSPPTAGQVIIGNPICSTPPARLTVTDDNFGTTIQGIASFSGDNVAVRGTALFGTPPAFSTQIGVLGEAGIYSNSKGAGVVGFSGPANIPALPTTCPMAIYGNSTSNPGGGWSGYFDGDFKINGSGGSGCGGTYALTVNGSALSTGIWQGSDRRYKDNIKSLEGTIEKVKKLSGYTYNFKTNEFKDKNFPKTEQIGLIAQELKEVFPQLVSEDKEGYLAVNYQGMVPVLLQAIKEQQQQIDELKNLVKASTTNDKQSNNQSVDLSDKNAIVLDQNVPNPFAESTVIHYNIPTDFAKAQIIFSTNEGKVIRSVDVSAKGPGKLTVFANDLSSGMYTYTLVVDGKTIDTKKMVKQ